MVDGSGDAARLSHGVPLVQAVRSDVGRVRGNNEDSFGTRWLDDGSLLVVVCDGMGGHEAGEVASRLAVDVVTRLVEEGADTATPNAVLHEALIAANESILTEGRTGGKRGMGTTAVVAWLRGANVWVAHVGDSRLYLLREGRVVDRSVDHTRVQALLDKGLITASEARDHPEAGMLTRALGHARMANGQAFAPEVYAAPLELHEGDAIVLSSDGLHDLVEDAEVAHTVSGLTPEEAAQRLVDLALERGGHDNVTVAVVTYGDRASAEAGALEASPAAEAHLPATAAAPAVPMAEAAGGWGMVIAAAMGGLLLFASAFVAALAAVRFVR